MPEYDRLVLRRSRTLAGLATAAESVLWRAHPTGPMGAHIWAPELHRIDGTWYLYFASAPAEDVWAIRIWVLENPHPDPFRGTWVERGQLRTAWETFALDATTFSHRGRRYLALAQHEPGTDSNSWPVELNDVVFSGPFTECVVNAPGNTAIRIWTTRQPLGGAARSGWASIAPEDIHILRAEARQ